MTDFFICAATNLFRIFLIDRFVSVFLGKDEKEKKIKIIVCACFYIINTALFWEFHTAWINIICNLAGISAIVRLYTKSIRTNLFVTFSIYLVNCGCDVAAVSLFVNYRDGEVHSQIYDIISVFLIFVCELLIEKIITIHKNTEVSWNFSLISAPICSILTIGILIYSEACSGAGLAIASMGLLVVNFFMLYLYNQLLHLVSQKYETEMLRTQVQVYANQLETILQGEERIKALRHDMKHHLNELMLLANKRGAAEIQEYIERMQTFVQNPKELIASGNMEIDSVLNYMIQKAREELDNVVVKVMLPEKVSHFFDINVLLGNLLENAIEAAGQTDKKYLGLSVTLKRGVLKIKIENSFDISRVAPLTQRGNDGIFPTTKPFKEQHGIGLKNVKRIVEKYNGAMTLTPQNDIFCVNLILYMSKIENMGV